MRQAGGNPRRPGIKMLEEPPLITINSNIRRPSVAQIAGFQNIPTGFVVDAMYGAGALDRQIQPVGAGRDIRCVAAGPALTADCGPADILALLASLNFIQNGDIVVSSFGGHQGCASVGDRVMGMIKNCRSRAAALVHGFDTGLPVFKRAGAGWLRRATGWARGGNRGHDHRRSRRRRCGAV